MDLFATLVKGNNSELLGALTQSGFSTDQAKDFLPAALSGITDAAQKLDTGKLLSMGSSDQLSSIMSALDMQKLTSLVGGDSALARNGIQALLPKVLDMLKGGSGGLSGLAGGVSKLFG